MRLVIFDFPTRFPPDAVEQRVPDAASARALAAEHDPAQTSRLEEATAQLRRSAGASDRAALLQQTADAIAIAFARLAVRHGTWGSDFHNYHNEGHILEILGGRLGRLLAIAGPAALDARDRCALALFAACHDLRQREVPEFAAGVGSNERASIEEAHRILDASGFSRDADAELYLALDLMISGSTFDARAPARGDVFNTAENAQSGGALAAKLDRKLDKHRPGWRDSPELVHALELALIAADLDTANVAEPFAAFAASAERLCRERESLRGRSLDERDSAGPVLAFLTDGQERYFFDLHRFNSTLGRAAFADEKAANAAKLRAFNVALKAFVTEHGAPATGRDVIDAYRATLTRFV